MLELDTLGELADIPLVPPPERMPPDPLPEPARLDCPCDSTVARL